MQRITGFKLKTMTLWLVLCVLLLSLVGFVTTAAAEQLKPLDQAAASLATLEDKKAAVKVSTVLDGASITTILGVYDTAITAKILTNKLTAELDERLKEASAAAEQITKLEKELAQPLKASKTIDARSKATDVNEVQAQLLEIEASYSELQARQKKYSDALTFLLEAGGNNGETIIGLSKRVDEINKALAEPSAQTAPTALTEARKDALLAKREQYRNQLKLKQFMLDKRGILSKLYSLERDLATRKIAQLQPILDKLRAMQQQYRQASASRVTKQAEIIQQSVLDLPAPIRRIADETVKVSNELQELIRQQTTTMKRLNSSAQNLEQIKQQALEARQRVETVGNSEAIGRMLQKRAAELPSLGSYRRGTNKRLAEINRMTDRQIDIDERRRELMDPEQMIEGVLIDVKKLQKKEYGESFVSSADEANRDANLVRSLFIAQQDDLSTLSEAYGRSIAQLTAQDIAERQLVAEADRFITFINERLLWIKNVKPIAFGDASSFIEGIAWLASPAHWQRVTEDFMASVQSDPVRSILAFVLVIIIFFLRNISLRRITEIAKQTVKIRFDSIGLTFKALGYTLILAAPLPLSLFYIAWRLAASPTADIFSLSVSSGLYAAGSISLLISFLRYTHKENGLGDRHFRWPQQIYKTLEPRIVWLQMVMPPLVFIVTMVMKSKESVFIQGLGRPAFVVLMGILLIFAYSALRHSGPVRQFLKKKKVAANRDYIKFIWFPMSIILPVAMIVGSITGYQYTALMVMQHVYAMVILLFCLLIMQGVSLRTLYLAQKKFRYREAIKKRKELIAIKQSEDIASGVVEKKTPEENLADIEIQEVNYSSLSDQAKKLLNTALFLATFIGLWLVWTDLMPVFNVLESVNLPFSRLQIVDGVEKTVSLTLQDVAFAMLFLIVTAIAAKNIPGLLEIILLQRLNMDAGSRYAIKTLSQYFIVATGVVVVFNAIGAEWSSIQWLVAALSVGLGFGLQEIVANFVSGIIILFERPIRVGDTVTVGDVSGKVTRIRIRATTITNWDRQELLVPNKEFITGRLLNWTLSDQINRFIIPVGVAYGSDVEKALQIMLECATENKNVLADPAPMVSFESFGDNALLLNLRIFLDSLEYRIEAITEIHKVINKKFKEAGISIPFPQRDVYLATKEPLEIKMSSPTINENE
tara:strand:- start:57615 stop:61106 length:3492 start_codon:yes stop_codon:yes gene_type:complete